MRRFLVFVFGMLLIVGLYSLSALAGPGCTAIDSPTTDYTDATNKCSLGTLGDPPTSDCKTNGNPQATFSIPLEVRQVGVTWGTWSSPPFSESATPLIGFTGIGGVMLTINLGDFASSIAGFELEPNNFEEWVVSAAFLDGDGGELARVERPVLGRMGARLFAVDCGESVISSIQITAPTGALGFAIAQLRGSSFEAAAGFEETTESSVVNGVSEGSTSNVVN